MALQHHLRNTGIGVPELDATIFGAAHDPFAMWRQANAEDVILQENLIEAHRDEHELLTL